MDLRAISLLEERKAMQLGIGTVRVVTFEVDQTVSVFCFSALRCQTKSFMNFEETLESQQYQISSLDGMKLEVLKKVSGDEEHIALKDTLQNITAKSQLFLDRHQNIIQVKEGQPVPEDYVPVPNTLALDNQQLVEQSSVLAGQPNVVAPGVAITASQSALPPANMIAPQRYQPYPAVDPMRLSRTNMSAS